MSEQQIDKLISPNVDEELKKLIVRLEQAQSAFKPIMKDIRSTFNAMGGGAKDVRTLLKAIDDYNKTMGNTTPVIREYNTIQAQIEALSKRINETNKQQIITLERLKNVHAANTATVKQELTQEAALLEAKRKSNSESKTDIATKVGAQEATRRLVMEMKRHIDVVNGTYTSNGKEMMTYRAKSALLANMREKYKDVSEEIQKQLIPTIQKLDAELKKQDRAMGVGTRTVGLYENFKGAGSALSQLFPSVAQIGRLGFLGGLLLATGTAAKAYYEAVKYGIKVNMEFEQSNANLAAVMGTTSKSIEALRQQALELGRTTEYSASQVTQAQTELAKLGFGQQTILNMTKPLLGFATALDASLPQAAEVAGQALRAFNLPSTQTEQVLTEMTLAANKSAMDFAFLERSIAIVGASASVAKVPLKDTLSLLGVLSNSGLDASRAATALRNIFLYLADDSKKLGKAMKGTNMDAASISKAFVELRNKGVDLADMFQLTDKRAVNALAVLIQNAEQIIKLKNEIQYTTGALDALRNTRLDTLQGDVKLFKAAWDGYWLSFRENLPLFRDFVRWGTEFLNKATDSRVKDAYNNQSSSSYATDKIDKSRVTSESAAAYDELEAISKKYLDTLGKDEKEADRLFKLLLDKRAEIQRRFVKEYKSAANGVIEANKSIDNALTAAVDNDGIIRTSKIVRENVELIKQAHNESRSIMSKIEANAKNIQKDTAAYNYVNPKTGEGLDRKAKLVIQRRIDSATKENETLTKQLDASKVKLETAYDKAIKFSAKNSDINVYQKLKASAETEKRAYGRFLTAKALNESIASVVSENERTLVPQGVGDYKVDTGKKSKAELEAERLAKKRKENADAEELANYNRKIAILRTNAAELKSMSDDSDILEWDLRKEAVDAYVKSLQKVEEFEYARKDLKLRQDAKDNLKLSDTKVADPNVIDPVTGKPQTEVEKATLQQRLALYEDYIRQRTDLDIQGSKDKAQIDDQRTKYEKKAIEDGVDNFKKGLEKRIKEVEDWGAKEKKKAATMYNQGGMNDTQLKDVNAETDVFVAKRMASEVEKYYKDFISKSGLPKELKDELIKVYDEQTKQMATAITESEADYEAQTGKNFQRNSKRTMGQKLRSLVRPSVKRNEQGEIDPNAVDKAQKLGKDISNVINSGEVQVGLDAFGKLTEVMSSYYDAEIAKIDAKMAKEQEMYDQQSKLLDESLKHTELNNEAGLLSEENYNATKRKNAIEQRALDKKHAAEQAILEKEKRKLQRRAAIWEKAQSLSSAIMNTAMGITSALALGVPLGPIFAKIIGALGGAQVALIASQKIPEYAKGTMSHSGGLMYVGDGGKHEYIVTPDGRVQKSPDKTTLMYAPKNTKVFKDEDAYLSYLKSSKDSMSTSDNIDVYVNNDDPEQKKLLRSINGGIDRLNANERYRIQLERNNKQFDRW